MLATPPADRIRSGALRAIGLTAQEQLITTTSSLREVSSMSIANDDSVDTARRADAVEPHLAMFKSHAAPK